MVQKSGRNARWAALLLVGAAAACSDSTTAPAPDPVTREPAAPAPAPTPAAPVPTTLEVVSGANQTSHVNSEVAVAPVVRVKDERGQPMAGVAVRFTVVAGNGNVAVAAAATALDGTASAMRWTLGGEGLNELEVSAATLAPIRILATALPLPKPAAPPTPAPTATTVEVVAGSNQTAQTGSAVLVAPAVRIKDERGQPMAGVVVRFTVVTGGGSVAVTAATTSADGSASAGRWTLGNVGLNELEVRAGALPPIRIPATATAPPPPPAPATTGAYSITVRYLATATPRQQEAVSRAVATWQNAIRGDLVDIPLNAPAGACWPSQPAIRETVDDILIYVEFVNIDGVGKTLGEAGPCYVRSDNGLPILGHLKLDAADLTQMEGVGTLNDVVLHEIGHVLGIGTLWSNRNLLSGAGTDNPVFVGAAATSSYKTLGGAGSVPVENTGSAGTRDGHWRESIFGNELMTGWINASPNPLSALTIYSLQDLGYGANPGAATSYTLGAGNRSSTQAVEIGSREKMVRPKFKVDRHGNKSDLPRH